MPNREMRRGIVTILIIVFMSCQGKVPVTIDGKSFSEYANGEKRATDQGIYRRWKLVSINYDIAPYDVNLNDLDFILNFTQEQDSLGNLFRGEYMKREIWGYFISDDQGAIRLGEIVSNGSSLPAVPNKISSPIKPITEVIYKGLRNVYKYQLEEAGLILISDQEILEFRPY